MTAAKHPFRSLLTILAASALSVGLLGPLPAHAAPLPDLKVTALGASSDSVAAGSALGAAVTVKNTGRKKAGSSLTRVYLSRDEQRSRSDVLLGSTKVPGLAPGQVSRKSVQLAVPGTVAARRYFLVACADAKNAVRESREGNNCRATTSKVEVTDGGGSGTFPLDPDPIDVDSTLDTAHAVTQTASALDFDGATTITTTGADGTTYTLEVPYRALLSPEKITLTPVAGVPGLPLSGGLVAGVQIEPHGLLLQEPASLTIESPSAGALASQTGFLFHADGDDFHLYPMDAPEPGDDKNTIRMTLTHFSTPGVALATGADRANVESHPPARTQAQVEQAVSGLLAQERQSQLNGNAPSPAVMQQVLVILNAYFDDVLRGRLQAAETNADLGPQAIAEGLAWVRQMSLLGDEDNPRVAEVMQRIEKIAKNMMNKFWTRCTVDHELAAIAWLIGVARMAALFGWEWSEEALDKAQRCSNFEVRFDSSISGQLNMPGDSQSHQSTYAYHLKSTFEVPWPGSAEGALGYEGFDYYYRIDYPPFRNQCVDPNHYTETTDAATTAGKTLAQVLVHANPFESVPGHAPPPLVTFRVAPGMSLTGNGQPKESYHTDSYSCAPYSSDDTRTGWLSAFTALHDHQSILEFEVPTTNTESIFTKSWIRTIPEQYGSQHEETFVELWHEPLT